MSPGLTPYTPRNQVPPSVISPLTCRHRRRCECDQPPASATSVPLADLPEGSWRPIGEAILAALQPFPDAFGAVVKVLLRFQMKS
ncbi:MAG: hypothetical protein FJW39_04830 [Acidobacteria bacterium]|nr:hypothetical protein [Acidobacteriota bacterium]